MNNVWLKAIMLWISICLGCTVEAQIAVTDARTALQLVQNLAGPGVSVSNATLTCSDSANGTFVTTVSNLGLEEGIILSTGRSVNAVGSASNFRSTAYYRPGDTSLDALIFPTTTNDACILEFDFVPLGDTMKFRYVFGSEEYTSFSCTDYNDAFGFFISGPGYTVPQNIALIPGTSIPVAINSTSGVPPTNPNDTVKCQSMGTGSPFSQYYVDNSAGTTVAYNGFTSVLTATAIVVPCSTYHLKLTIGDADDQSYDSGVFIEAGSFSSNDLSVSTSENLQAPVPYCVRGCKNGVVTFKRQKVTSLPLTVKYQIAGDASNGVDYATIADSVVIPASDSVIAQTIIPLTTASGTKTIKLLVYSPYACSTSPIIADSCLVTIYDSIYARIITPDTSICPGTSLTLETIIDTSLRFAWLPKSGINDTTLRTPSITASANVSYYLTASLPGSTCDTVHDVINIMMSQSPNVTSQVTNVYGCIGTDVLIPIKATGDDLTYKWQIKSGGVYNDLGNGVDYDGVTKDTLKLKSISVSWDGNDYRCIVSGKCTPNDTTSPITLNIADEPNITANPVNDSICQGGNALFVVQATGTNLTYQWQISYGFGFSDLINTGPYTGVFKDSMKITAATVSMSGQIFRCIVSGLCSPNDTTPNATLVVHKLPKINTDPVSIHVCPDLPSSFSLSAEAGNIGYQWQVNTGSGFSPVSNDATYNGSNTNTLQISSSLPSMTGYTYRCIVSGACLPNDTSTNAVLTVDTIPVVSNQPAGNIVCEGDTASFSIQAYGSGTLTYQWQVNNGAGYNDLADGIQYTGSTTNSLKVLAATSLLDSNEYRCIVHGTCDGDTSDAVTLTVKTLPVIGNDPNSVVLCEGDATMFAIAATGSNLTYQWQVKTGTTFTDIVNNAIYSGAQADTLQLATTVAGMNKYVYRCIVSGYCTPKDTSNVAMLTVHIRPDITVQPNDSTVCDGNVSAFKITAVGTNIAYQWQINTGSGYTNITNNTLYTGATKSLLRISSSTLAMNGYLYRCIINGICTPPDTSMAAVLNVKVLPQIIANPVDTTVCDKNNASFTISAIGTDAAYLWQVDKGTGFVNLSNGTVYNGATTASLYISACTPAMNNYAYRCIVSGSCTPPDTTLSAMLHVLDLPSITQETTDSIVCDGQSTAFGISATGTAITYQWQVDDGTGFRNISNNSVYSGVNSDTLKLQSANVPMSGYQYRCIIAGTCAPPDTTIIATLTVRELPDITRQPSDSTICAYGDASFSITATGTAITYQWQVNTGTGFSDVNNSAIYSGATASVLNISAAPNTMDGYLYRCIVTGVCTPPDTSTTAIFHVSTPPSLSVAPHATQICEGGDAAFSVTATGTNLYYQWQVDDGSGYANISNNMLYSGVNTNTLYITGVTSAMSGYLYQCIVSGDCPPAVTSGALTLMLTVFTKPVITAQTGDKRICAGTNTRFAIKGTGTGISYQWQADNGNGYVNLADDAIFSGTNSDSLNITSAPKDISGSHYRCVVIGVCLPDAISTPVTLTVDTLAAVLQQAKDSIVCEQTPISFTIAAEGTNRSYQWQEDNGGGFTDIPVSSPAYAGSNTEILSVPNVVLSMQGYKYRCIVSAICNTYDTSGIVILSVDTIPVVMTSPGNSIICEHDTTIFSIQTIGTDIQYKWQVDAGTGYTDITNSTIYSGANTDVLQVSSAPANMSNYKYRCIISGTCNPPDTSAEAILTVNRRPDIVMQARDTVVCEQVDAAFEILATGTNITYQWLVDNGSGWTILVNNSEYSGATSNKLVITNTDYSMSGWLYSCAVSGSCTPIDTSLAVTLTVNQLVSVTTQPLPSVICDGDNTSFQVAAIGTGISYQWQVDDGAGYRNVSNNATYSGAATNMLSVSTANTGMDGEYYRCIVSGICLPNDTSTAVLLTINALPAIAIQPEDSTVCEGIDAEFSISATGTAITYQWQQNDGAGFADLADNGTYTGSLTNTLHIASPPAFMNGYEYRCIVSGACNPPDTSLQRLLTVHTSPVITLQPSDTIICVSHTAEFSIISSGSLVNYQWQIDTGRGYEDIMNTVDYSGATTNILTIASVTTAMHSDKFRCIVTGICAPADTSGEATLSVFTPAAIITQPADIKVCAGESLTFNTRATGSRLTYQWQVNSGGGFQNVLNGGIYSGATSSKLKLDAVTTAEDGYKYRCIINGYCDPGDTTDEATLGVRIMPVAGITPQGSVTFCEGDSVLLLGEPAADVTYRWQLNGMPISKAGKYIAKKPGIYKLIVATQYCTSTPDSLQVIVHPLPEAGIFITSRPVICADSFVTITAFNATQESYQWYKNGEIIADARSYYYNAFEEGLYDLLVTNNYNCMLRSKPQYLDLDKLSDPEIITDNLMMCTNQQAKQYQWYWNGATLTGEINNCYLAPHNGYYKLYIVNANSCPKWSNQLAIDKVAELWPNPTSGLLNIMADNAAYIEISDVSGKTVYISKFQAQVDIRNVADGVYMVRLYNQQKELIKAIRIVKKEN